MKKLKYIFAICASFLLLSTASAQIQTLGISQSQSGNPGNNCGACYTITVQYSISNIAATGTTIVCTFPNNVFDICSYGGSTPVSVGTTTTLTFNLGNQPTSANSVSYQVRFKPGTTCNGTSGILTARISTIEHPVPVLSAPLTLTAVATEGWAITKYIATSSYQWYYGYNSGNPFPYTVSICGSTVDVYYHIRLSNSGCVNVTGSSVTDNLPAGATVVGVHNGWPTTGANLIPSTTGPGTVTWNAGNGVNTLDVNTYAYDYYIHLTFPLSSLNTLKCNSATLNGTNACTLAAKTANSATECITLLGAYPGTACGAFGTPYYINYNWYYFIGCPAWLNISLSQTNQCSGSTTTLNNIGYNAAIPVQMHVDSFRMNAIPAGKTVTITVNTTCGPYTHTFNGPLSVATINFYAPPFNIPGACVITNFALTSNMGITGNATQDFGQLYFTILTNTWNTNAPVLAGTTVAMTGATYSTSNGPIGCAPSFVTSNKIPQIETVKDICNYNNYYSCVNPNDTIKYSIAVHNYGTGNFSGGSIRDVLPVGLQYVPNSSTFGKYSVYTKCNVTNQNSTGMSVNHAEATNTTNLQWNLPALNADCNSGSDWYVINFKAVITTLAPAGLLTNHEDCYDGSNAVVTEYNYWNNSAYIYVCERKVPLELTKEVSANNQTWDSCVSVSPGATVYYRLKVKNAGNVAFSQIKMMDLLPTPGDKYVVSCNSRGSTIPIYLTSALPLGNASTIEYSTNFLPTRGAYLNLIPDNTIGCNSAATWLSYALIPGIPAAIQNQKAIRIDFASYTLAAGQTETYFFSAQVPPGATAGSVGWNSFAATASQNSVQTLGAESRRVCVNIVDTGCGCIGNFVWFDANGNGLQDAGEPGINGCTITLFDASNNQVGLPHISTNNIGGQPGYYQFCGLTAGTYHLVVTPPAGYMLTIQNNSNPALNSDINPNTLTSANFQFNCQDNNDLDIGLVVDDGCNCDQSHWGGINISDSPVIIDNPHNYDGMPVNSMNKQSASTNSIGGSQSGAIPSGNFSLQLNCGKKDSITLQCKTTYNFTANYICNKPKCGSVQIVIHNPLGGISTFTNTASFTTNDAGYYTINIYGKCGNKTCDSCVFKFKVICPICPCEYKLGVKPGKYGQTVIDTDPKYTIYNQQFIITAPAGALFTQVRAEIVSFNLTDNYSNECISCKNLPYTWGSIYNATNINTNAAVADSITMGPNPPVTQFTPGPGNTYQNPRETIWGNYSGFTLPGSLNVQFVLPHPSLIGCCTLYARICVKFTFRDRNCKECEVISCFTITIPQPSSNNGSGVPTGTNTKDLPIVNTAPGSGCATCGTANAAPGELHVPEIMAGKGSAGPTSVESGNDETELKKMDLKIAELKKLKESGVRRGDIELLPDLEKQSQAIKDRIRKK